ncbi:MAG: AAA family ATPase, partial [Bacteroidales bacterium]|nr:AAA family ATPase [Bacteroidales bacterium]
MFERSAVDWLREWRQRPNHKPLVLRGARQVGKTTLVNAFAKDYEVYLTLNLEKSADRQLFESDLSIDEIVTSIYLLNGKARRDVSTLLFIDEIQNSPKAVALLRYFYEEVSGIDVIAAGSLLENLIDKHISFPVGRVEYMAVRPCSFYEFLGALGHHELQQAQKQGKIPLPLHSQVLHLFRVFTLVGWMPDI